MKDNQTWERISAFKEWFTLTRQAFMLLLYDKKNLLVSLAFPVASAIITIFIAGEEMYTNYEGTKSACFVVSSSAIWGGLFNSIQIIVRERDNIKRDYSAGLRIRCYTLSRAIVQLCLCIVQSILLSMCFIGIEWYFGNEMPMTGVFFNNPIFELFISVFLLMYASDAMGLFISCVVRKTETANVMAPYILIFQLIFSGILFKMSGFTEKLSYLMLSRWGMEALGVTNDLNALPLQIQLTIPSFEHEAELMFNYSKEHLFFDWSILALFAILFLVFGNLFLHRVARDSR